MREEVRKGTTIRVVDLNSLDKEDLIGWGGGLGSPEVSGERLMGEEYVPISRASSRVSKALSLTRVCSVRRRYNESTRELLEFMGVKIKALAALEIGGSNGMINVRAVPPCSMPSFPLAD